MQKKWFLLVGLLLGTVANSLAQTPAGNDLCTVLHVAGTVRTVADSKPIHVGQQLASSDVITFVGENSSFVGWQPSIGLISVAPAPSRQGGKPKMTDELFDLTSSVKILSHSTRLQQFDHVSQLAAHFQGRKYPLLGRSWIVSKPPFKVKGDTVLLLKFRNIAENFQVSHKLHFSGDTLLLDPASFLDENGTPVNAKNVSDFRLWWYDKATKTYAEIAYFEFVLWDQAQVRSEIDRLLGFLQGQSQTEKQRDVKLFAYWCYGELDEHAYLEWMQRNYPKLMADEAPQAKPPGSVQAPRNAKHPERQP